MGEGHERGQKRDGEGMIDGDGGGYGGGDTFLLPCLRAGAAERAYGAIVALQELRPVIQRLGRRLGEAFCHDPSLLVAAPRFVLALGRNMRRQKAEWAALNDRLSGEVDVAVDGTEMSDVADDGERPFRQRRTLLSTGNAGGTEAALQESAQKPSQAQAASRIAGGATPRRAAAAPLSPRPPRQLLAASSAQHQGPALGAQRSARAPTCTVALSQE